MSSTFLTSDERRERLEEARRALQYGDINAQIAAMKRLPETGAKATALREQLEERVRATQLPFPLVAGSATHRHSLAGFAVAVAESPRASPNEALRVGGGFRFRFALSDLDSSALFRVRVKGAEVLIELNSAHPAVNDIAVANARGREPEVHPAFRRLLLAWARLELEGPGGVHRERLQQLREDLGRLMRGDEP